tara:strand:+ start:5050 stop:6735 length:1686 start_codon:yes stop_codon:yes gene_type:complete
MATVSSKKIKDVAPSWLHVGKKGTQDLTELQDITVGANNHLTDGNNNSTGVILSKEGVDDNQFLTFQVGSEPRDASTVAFYKTYPLVVRNAHINSVNVAQYGAEDLYASGSQYRKLMIQSPNDGDATSQGMLTSTYKKTATEGEFITTAGDYKATSARDIKHTIVASHSNSPLKQSEVLIGAGNYTNREKGIHVVDNPNASGRNIVSIGGDISISKSENIQITGDVNVDGSIQMQERTIYVDDDIATDGIGTATSPYKLLHSALSALDGSSNQSITIYLMSRTSSPLSNAVYTLEGHYNFYNCVLNFVGVNASGTPYYNSNSYNFFEHDYPKIYTSMNNSGSVLESFGINARNCNISFRNLRLITPIYGTAQNSQTENNGGYGFVKSPNTSTPSTNNIYIHNSRIELGDAPFINTKEGEETNIYLNSVRIIRTDNTKTYGGIGALTNGQDQAGQASIPTWDASTSKYVNSTINSITVGYLAKIYHGKYIVSGESDLNSQPAGYFSHNPTDGTYGDPTTGTTNGAEKEYNLVANISATKIATTSPTGNIPINIHSNKVEGWY